MLFGWFLLHSPALLVRSPPVNNNRETAPSVAGPFSRLAFRRDKSSHNPRAERMTEKSAVTPIARSVQIKKNAPLDLAIAPPTPAPFMWRIGTSNPSNDPRRMMTYPDRLSVNTSVPYSQTTRIGTAIRFESVPGSIPRTMSSVRLEEHTSELQ